MMVVDTKYLQYSYKLFQSAGYMKFCQQLLHNIKQIIKPTIRVKSKQNTIKFKLAEQLLQRYRNFVIML